MTGIVEWFQKWFEGSPNMCALVSFHACTYTVLLAYPVASTGRIRDFIPFLRSLT